MMFNPDMLLQTVVPEDIPADGRFPDQIFLADGSPCVLIQDIDCDGAGNFVIWNEENAINVSESLKDIADMKISFADDAYGWKFMIAEITKLRDFNLDEFIGMEQECRELALFVQKLMGWIAGENTDYLCCEN